MYVYQCLYLLIMFLFIILFKEIGALYYGSVTDLKYNFYCTFCAQDDVMLYAQDHVLRKLVLMCSCAYVMLCYVCAHVLRIMCSGSCAQDYVMC